MVETPGQEGQPERAIGRQISLISRAERIYFGKVLKDYQITASEMSIMLCLHFGGELSQEQISRRVHINKVSLSRMSARLTEQGYLYRTPSDTDKRSHQLGLTEKARDLVPVLLEKVAAWVAILSQGLAQDEMDKTLIILEKIVRNVRHLTDA